MVGLPFNGAITVITANPLQPRQSCMMQNIPNWGGIWVETKGNTQYGAEEPKAILQGNIVLDDSYTMRCYTVESTVEQNTAKMTETWDEPGARTYDVTLKTDNRYVDGGCMVHTALHGTAFTQWLGSVDAVGSVNMNMQISEEWHVTQADGSEAFESTHNEVRVGSCTMSADGSVTATKHMIPGVRLY